MDNSGPAFPIMPPVDETGRTAVGYDYPHSGMTLRDYFAAQALIGTITENYGNEWGKEGIKHSEYAAKAAYRAADAMLIVRGVK